MGWWKMTREQEDYASSLEGLSEAGYLWLGECLRAEREMARITARNYRDKIERLEQSLRQAPMPIRESVYPAEAWHEIYSEWWHEHASEGSLRECSRCSVKAQWGEPTTCDCPD